MLPVIGDGAGVWSWIHVDDAAAATVAALERGRGGIYNITDDEPAPVAQWLPHLAAAVGAKPPLRVPAWLGRLMAGEAIVRWMTEGRGAANTKAKRELGWQPQWRSWRDGFRHALAVAGDSA
jgi:2-alkyl-3-oxoalkanoate reductase